MKSGRYKFSRQTEIFDIFSSKYSNKSKLAGTILFSLKIKEKNVSKFFSALKQNEENSWILYAFSQRPPDECKSARGSAGPLRSFTLYNSGHRSIT